jgi:hypothetical protein
MLSAAGLDLEVEDIHHDTSFPVEQNDVAPDQHVGAVRRRQRQHMLDLSGAGLNSLLQSWGSVPRRTSCFSNPGGK